MKRRHASVIGVSLLLAAMLAPSSVDARTPGSSPRAHEFGRPSVTLSTADRTRVKALLRHNNQAQQIFVQLNGRPVTSYQAASLAIRGTNLTVNQKTSIRTQLGRQQSAIRPRIAATGARIQSTFTDVLNGFRVLATPKQAQRIATIPGVQKLYSIPKLQRSDLGSADYVSAIKAWTDFGKTGAGVTIAIIDTGINYYHANFGGSGNPGWQNDNPRIVEPGTFPTAKVVGGYDLAGDNYDPEGTAAQQTPHPDPDPLDCKTPGAEDVQHGSHVAGIAAGDGVTSKGKTYTGPYTASAVSNTDFTVGPGIAPQAKLYALRVFGCAGSTFLVQDALERAVRAGVDVINMSLGSDLGTPGSVDSIAADAAAEAGIVVVASSGNSGQSAYITGTPAAAQHVISVGAVDANVFIPGGVVVDLPGSANDVGGFNMYDSKVPVSGTTHVLYDGTNVSDGCVADDWKPVKKGDVVVIVRGNCDFSYKRHQAQTHGAVAVVLINNIPATVVNPVPDPQDHIPMISVNPANQAALIAGDGQKATLHEGEVPNEFHGQMADFSSAGPSRLNNAIKPDVSAPGVNVNSTDGATVNKAKLLSGTSMAAPQVAGAAALILQANPSWSPQHVKGALVGTASVARVSPYDVRWSGSGIINVAKALSTDAWAESRDEQGSSSITFGYQPIDLNTGSSTALRVTQTIRLSNSGGHSTTFKLSNDANGSMMGASLSMPARLPCPQGRASTSTSRFR